MKTIPVRGFLGLVFVLVSASYLLGQTQPSLGEAARRLRAEKNSPPAKRFYDNDSIPHHGDTISKLGVTPVEEKPATDADAKAKDGAKLRSNSSSNQSPRQRGQSPTWK